MKIGILLSTVLLLIISLTIPVLGDDKEKRIKSTYINYAVYYNDVQIDDIYLQTPLKKNLNTKNCIYTYLCNDRLFNKLNIYYSYKSTIGDDNPNPQSFGIIETMKKDYLVKSKEWITYKDFLANYGFTRGFEDSLCSPDGKYHIRNGDDIFQGRIVLYSGYGRTEEQEAFRLEAMGYGDNRFVRISDIEQHFKRVDGTSGQQHQTTDLVVGDLCTKDDNPTTFPNRKPVEKIADSTEFRYVLPDHFEMFCDGTKKKDVQCLRYDVLLKPLIQNLDLAYIQNDDKKYILIYSYDYIKSKDWVDLDMLNKDIANRNVELKRSKIKPFEYDVSTKQFKLTGTGKNGVYLDTAVFGEEAFVSKQSVDRLFKKYYNVSLFYYPGS